MTHEPTHDVVDVTSETVLWLVTVVMAGAPVNENVLRAGLHRYGQERSFATSLRYATDRVEISYWDEGRSLAAVADQALELWADARSALRLRGWHVVGMEVLDQTTLRERSERGRGPDLLAPGEIKPLR